MRATSASKALDPFWLRFTDEGDVVKYGGQWYLYDESALLLAKAREQMAVEAEMGVPLVAVMNGFRQSTVLGDLAVAWLAVRAVDPAKAGDFDEFSPMVFTIQWTGDDPTPAPKDEAVPETVELPDLALPMDTNSFDTTLAPKDTVVLPIMPATESST